MVIAVANGSKTVALYSEKTDEIKTLKIGPWIKDRILLVDLGFYETQIFPRVEVNGGYFVSRIRKNMDPILVSIEGGMPKKSVKSSLENLLVSLLNNFQEKILMQL